jgi:hypothetical protein
VLGVSRAEVHALNTLLPTNRVKDVHADLNIGSRHPDEVQSTSDAKRFEPLLSHQFLPHKVEDMIGSVRQKITDGVDGIRLKGVDNIGGSEASGLVESLLLDVDDDDPRSAGDARATHCIEANASGAEDHDSVAGANVSRVQDGTGTGHNAAAEQRSLGERKLLGYDGELVLVDERLFSEAAQPEALEQANPIAA